MLGFLIAPLTNTLRPHFALSKTRLVTLVGSCSLAWQTVGP